MQVKVDDMILKRLLDTAKAHRRSPTAEANLAIHTWLFSNYEETEKFRLSPEGKKNQRVPRKQK